MWECENAPLFSIIHSDFLCYMSQNWNEIVLEKRHLAFNIKHVYIIKVYYKTIFFIVHTLFSYSKGCIQQKR